MIQAISVLFFSIHMFIIVTCMTRIMRKLSSIEILINSILDNQNVSMFSKKIESIRSPKPPEAKKGRTDAQKELASTRRKEWWAKKKALENPSASENPVD